MNGASNREPDGGVIWFAPALAARRSVPWWGLISAAVAFVGLVGGCSVATALQPSSFNWLASTVSTLTEQGAADRWVTIAAFAVTGTCGIHRHLTALIAWPVGAWRRGSSVPWGLRPAVSAAGVGALLALLTWYLVELMTRGGMAGLAERAMCVALVGWPLAVVLSCRRPAQP